MSAVLSLSTAPELRYARLSESDISEVVKIESEVYAFPWSAGNFRDSLQAGYQCWACWVKSELVGYAIWMISVDEAHLLNLAVATRWQRKGIGRHLLKFVMDEARKKTCVMLYLEVRPSNHVALQLYGAMGFRQLGLRRGYYPAINGREDALFLGIEVV